MGPQPQEAVVLTKVGGNSTGDLEHMQAPKETPVERSRKCP